MSNRKLEMAKRIAKAETRIAALHGIDGQLDLGNGLSLDNYRSALDGLREGVHAYNKLLSEAEEQRDRCKALGREVDNWTNRMLAAVGIKYGKESSQYHQAGGTRPSERKKVKAAAAKGKDTQNNPS